MLRLMSCLTLPLLALASAAGQETALPVQDLVHPGRLAPALRFPDQQPGFHWIYRQVVPDKETETVMGEAALLGDRAVLPWFDPGDLRRVLMALSNADLKIGGGMLLVDKADAAAALEGLSQLRRQLPPRVTLEVELERWNESGRETLLHVRQVVRAGSTVTFADTEKRRVVRDFDVEIAQAAATANPRVCDLAMGTCLAVRSRPVPGRGEVLIEAFARVAGDANAPPLRTLHDGIGPIDRAARELDQCGLAMRVPRGAKRSTEWTSASGARLRLTCSASWEDPQDAPGRGTVVRCGGLFQKGVAEFRTDVPEPDERPAAFATEATFHRAGAERVQVIGGEGSATVAVVVEGAKADQVYRDVALRLARRLAPAELEVSLLDVPAGVDPGEAAKEEATIARIAAHVVVGRSVAFSGRTEMRYLHDWSVEVAQSSRIPDPAVHVLRHGYHVDARVIADPRGRFEAVAIEAGVARLARIDIRKTTLAQAVRAGGVPDQSGSISPSIVLPEETVAIESPVVQRHLVSAILQLDENGKSTMRQAAPRLLGKDRDLVIVVRVKK